MSVGSAEIWRTPCRLVPDRKSTRLNSSHLVISYAVFCLKKLKSDDGGQKVMVIDKNSIAHERMVSRSVRQRDRVQIVSGIQEVFLLVTSGGLGLKDKPKVAVQAA